MANKRFFFIFGYIFLGLGIFDFILKVNTYGFNELNFLWFCSITLFLLAFGFILKSYTLLNSFLSMGLIVQPVFIIDYIWISFFGVELNGTSLYVFQPTFGLLEFISAAKHLFMIPFAFYGVFLLSRKNKKSYIFTAIFTILLLVVSYAFQPEYRNLNCVKKPCAKFFGGNLSGFWYFIFFVASMIILTLLLNFIINTILEKTEKLSHRKSYKISILMIFICLLSIATAAIVMASVKYSKIPKFRCDNENDCTNCPVEIKCRYFDSFGKDLALLYRIKNNDVHDYACDVYMKILPKDTEYKKIGEDYSIRSKKYYDVWENVSYPEVDSQIKLKLDCRML
ncbi:MAG: hypothetical protein Q8R04_00675 [Nanoarchaeota archaeon]|nr:hypothetical protein [Nanoarchaeota archaeon]